MREQYAHAPYLDNYLPPLEAIYARPHHRLVDLNLELIRVLWNALGLQSRLVVQWELGVSGTGSTLLVDLGHALGADAYVTLPFVEKYLDPAQFLANGITVRLTRFRPPIYPKFVGRVPL